MKYFVDDALKILKEEMKVDSILQDKENTDRFSELIDTHLQVKGLIELPEKFGSLKPYDGK